MTCSAKKVSYSYFIVHALIEFICFATLYRYFNHSGIVWLAAFAYDSFAFIPQGLFGTLYHRHPYDLGTVGVVLVVISVLMINYGMISLLIMALGNAMIHVAGAIATTMVSEGKCTPSAIYVAGGSFGLIFGQLFGVTEYPMTVLLLVICLVMEVLILYSNRFWYKLNLEIPEFSITNEDISFDGILYVALFVVTVRSFIGYSIPISWKKEVWQAIMLFFVMGAGKALGGVLADKYGARKVGVTSTLLCIPFLLFGKDVMIISVIGVFLFSLTMAITFAMCLSIIKDDPGLAFGVTTLGLFMGLIPLFVLGRISVLVNCILIVVLSVISAYGLWMTLK